MYVDYHSRLPKIPGRFRYSPRTIAVFGGGHQDFATKTDYVIPDAFIVSSYHRLLHLRARQNLFVDALNHRFAGNHGQRFTRKTGAGVAGGDNGEDHS